MADSILDWGFFMNYEVYLEMDDLIKLRTLNLIEILSNRINPKSKIPNPKSDNPKSKIEQLIPNQIAIKL
jgi:hypothetical protein